MSTNVSKEKREQLVAKIKAIKSYIAAAPQDENTAKLLAYIADIEKDIKGKKYGLVFEEHREAIDEILEANTPVLTEEKDLFIDNGGQMNFLIEGDNLAALQLLEKTHKGKIDLIYIDPPYNMGNKEHRDFIYDDHFVDNNDMFRHSKWLSFMEKRLKIAQQLLKDKGLIFISINSIEVSSLKLLCDDIFSVNNYVTNLIWKCRSSLYYTEPLFSDITEYILVYAKDKNQFWLKAFDKDNIGDEKNLLGFYLKRVKKKYDDEGYINPDNDPNGPYKTSGKVRNDGRPVYTVISPTGIKHTEAWIYSPEVFEKLDKAGQIYWGVDGSAQPRKKSYYKDFIGNVSSNFLSDEFIRVITKDGKLKKEKYFEIGTSESGTKELNDIMGKGKVFDYPKPSTLIKFLCYLYPLNNITILDFFAGSGTTGHAVMKLNAEDGGSRKFILCTNNENNICRGVTYERIKRVIERDKYQASLKYYKTDFIPISDKLYYEYADELLKHIRELVELENGINFNGNAEIAIILTEQELDNFTANIPKVCKTVYLGHDVLPSEAQEILFKDRSIAVKIIPDYYYRELEG